MNGLLQQKEKVDERQKVNELVRRGRVRFTMRSLSGKLVISAALTLLLCMLLFGAVSWYLVKAFYEREARSDASTNLTSISQTYLAQSGQHLHNLTMEATSAQVAEVFTEQTAAQKKLTTAFTLDLVRARLADLTLMNGNRRVLTQVGESLPDGLDTLLSMGL